ncbi:MAG: purine-nucleoside phosphorylase [Hyphomicrobiales bacterium]|nr:purine-nucleoside phosphorylase [Hyphomicrobiales bacterium]MDE2115828.1 purine-nucleoside phosphorylase [Hyphomicrobiales bacterium]
MDVYSPAEAAAKIIKSRGLDREIEVAFVLGTGLGSLAEALENPIIIPFSDLPGFPKANVSGHIGQIAIGMQEGTCIAYLQGRSHYYETGDATTMRVPLETLVALGAHTLVLTNAAGSCNKDIYPGCLATITDHINFSGRNPLLGLGGEPNFMSMVDAYEPRLIKRMKRAALNAGINLPEAIYMWFSGPTFETPAEVRMAKTLGADLVGMSTVPEVILARTLGLRVAALSIVTNFAAGFSNGNPTHTGSKDMALQGSVALKRLIRAFLKTKEEAWGIRQVTISS